MTADARAPGTRGPTARCAAGEFRGGASGGVEFWKGIRYAEAPTGMLRWRAPRAASPVSADAVRFGAAAPQSPNRAIRLGDGVRLDEDCLFLNVWRPAGSEGEPLPVMVWIHGGAYALGSGSQPLYDGGRFAVSQGVVVVTLNYRLGAFGFLELGALLRDRTEFDGNLGLRDVLLALEWVRDNIEAFGGNAARVTIAGESSGAGMVGALLTCEAARGLFTRAIMQSAPAASMYGIERAEAVAARFVRRLGIEPRDTRSLRNVGVERILAAASELYSEIPTETPGRLAFAPVVDGELLPEAPIRALSRGEGAAVPLIIGTNRDEASVFRLMRSPVLPITTAQLRRMVDELRDEQPEVKLPGVEHILRAYAASGRRGGIDIARDLAFRLPATWIAEGHATAAGTWLYRFDHAAPLLRITGLGATHGSELPYVWGNLGSAATFGGQRLAHRISAHAQGRWGAFVRGGPPDVEGAPPWPLFGTRRASLVIGRVDRETEDLDASLRAAWGARVFGFQ
ncbi:carboxylesterase/lipase family protein [Gryllotalpicola protaetiae]|uniref:Carboxylic ester hydrolase n=1 Tax=Gryllotalpicola protaetiae TaxID=2419771 RepID=A0A387BP00_9MICO|nr:carboxylesterase/lipase family protein [Gryllotalpicola protaetiae]AYG03764.1 carboxylesterase/lipase family protein [Gryllotalpicola protaetiae]